MPIAARHRGQSPSGALAGSSAAHSEQVWTEVGRGIQGSLMGGGACGVENNEGGSRIPSFSEANRMPIAVRQRGHSPSGALVGSSAPHSLHILFSAMTASQSWLPFRSDRKSCKSNELMTSDQ